MASKELPISALHSQVSTQVNVLYAFLFSFVLFGHVRQLVFHVCAVGHAVCVWLLWTPSSWRGSGAHCPHEVPRYQATPEGREDQYFRMNAVKYYNGRKYEHTVWLHNIKQDITCCCGSELSALFGTTFIMGLHAGSPACKPLYIGPPGPSAMGGWGGSMVPPYIDIGIPWTDNHG